MSTFKEFAESKVTITIKPKEGLAESLTKNLLTLSLLAFCIYISSDNGWWTVVTGILFLVYLWGNFMAIIGANSTTFKDTKSAINYLNNLKI